MMNTTNENLIKLQPTAIVDEVDDYLENYDEGGEDEIMDDNMEAGSYQATSLQNLVYESPDFQANLQDFGDGQNEQMITVSQINEQPAAFDDPAINYNNNNNSRVEGYDSADFVEASQPKAINIPIAGEPSASFTISLNRGQQQASATFAPSNLPIAPVTIPMAQSQKHSITIPFDADKAAQNKIQSRAPPLLQQIVQSALPQLEFQMPHSPFYQQASQFQAYPQTPLPPTINQPFVPPMRQVNLKQSHPLTKVYKVHDRQLNIKIDPEKLMFKAQIIYELHLDEPVLKNMIQSWSEQEVQKVQFDLKILSKHYKIISAFEIDAQTTEKLRQFAFNSDLIDPQKQALRQKEFYPNPIQLNELESKERQQFISELTDGTLQIGKRFISFKPRKLSPDEMKSKFKPVISILVEYFCDKLSEGSTLRYVNYRSEEDETNHKYLYTNDLESHCWLPLIIGTESMPSIFTMKFIVPKEYMVIASGFQKMRIIDKLGDCLHTYVLDKQTTPDKVGFICCLMPFVTDIPTTKCTDGAYACFVSSKKQSYFNHSIVVEVINYLSSLLKTNLHPSRQLKLIFVPNLFAKKFPKQALSYGGGLHIFDQEIIFRPNQMDKRHHLYKHVAGAITFDYFGFSVREQTSGDAWLLESVRQRIGDRFKKRKCGALLYRYQTMRSIEKIYEKMKNGVEMFPLQRKYKDSLQSLGPSHPSHQFLSDIFYRKCSLLMHMIESNIDEDHLDKIFREMYHEALENQNLLSQMNFRKKFKKICGMQPLNYYQNWIWATGCPKLELSYEFNKRNNSLDLTLKQKSTTVKSATERNNIESKYEKIFSLNQEQRKTELNTSMETFLIEERQAARRFFIGEINLMIYQVEGSGGDIKPQQQKMTLKEFKSVVNTQISLQGKVKRTMQNRKKDFDQIYQAQGENETKKDLIQSDVKKFEMNEFELEDFPLETKNIFLGRELDNNPVLWIRVDPDMEFIRKVNIIQDKRNNWLFQLLRENDIIGQIEAARRLHVYNEDLVYGILKTVASSENYFYKVRREVLKSLSRMEIYTFNQYLLHESFLLKLFNKNRILDVGPNSGVNSTGQIQFYKENDFSNILEYFVDRGILKAISQCKEQRLILLPDKQRDVEKFYQRSKAMQEELSEVDVTEPVNTNAITLTILDSQIKTSQKHKSNKLLFNDKQFKTTTATVAQMLMRVLEQNDNSENCIDDSFYLKDLIAALGRLDNIIMMPEIAREIYRQFKLDQISNSSPQFSITLGCIKAYFNMRKQIFIFRMEKLPYINAQDPKVIIISYEDKLLESTNTLDTMKAEIDKILINQVSPLLIRSFIFNQEVKNLMLYKNESFCKCLSQCLKIIYNLTCQGQLMFAFNCFRDLCMYLEEQKLCGKLSMIDVYLPNNTIIKQIWQMNSLPHSYLSHEFSYWAKRILQRLYGSNLPQIPQNLQYMPNYDPVWSQSETDLFQTLNQNQPKITTSLADQSQLPLQNQAPHKISPINNKESTQIAINIKIGGGNTSISNNNAAGPGSYTNNINLKSMEKVVAPILVQPSLLQPTLKQFQDPRDRGINFNNQGQFKISIMGGLIPNVDTQDEKNEDSMMEEGEGAGGSNEESEYDPFAAEVYPDPEIQKCWLILGEIFYHYDATDFLEPITEDKFGKEVFDDYCSVVKVPIDINTIMERVRSNYYLINGNSKLRPKDMFYRDVMLIFSNCREYNEPNTGIVNSSNTL